MENIYVYGDSIMKATAPDENMKYKFHINKYLDYFAKLPVNIVNRAKFGASSDKGLEIIERDISKGLDCDIALIEYGGNDCNFNWSEISSNPMDVHEPKISLEKFLDNLRKIIARLRECGAIPVLMTLPPIDSEKYLNFITRNGLSRENILSWLGESSAIYRFQEMYSNAIAKLSVQTNTICIDMRGYILPNRQFNRLISADGIHPTTNGYDLIFSRLFEILKEKLNIK